MFAVVISEKGGAERREVFDRTEISVGRVQGNDLMLPKGNVSKRHARLLYRDGRFIVTDLNSTNGTYVNRRRISQATIVREGDRIYIGDFVLRIEVRDSQASDSSSGEITGSGALFGQEAGQAPREEAQRAASPPVSHFPLERDPDEGDAAEAVYPKVPGPPKVPSGARAGSVEPSSPDREPSSVGFSRPTKHAPEPSSADRPVPREEVADSQAALYRVALGLLVTRSTEALGAVLEGEIDDSVHERVGRVLDDQMAALRRDGHLASGVAGDRLVKDARAELVALGPLGPLLADDDVTEITVPDFQTVMASRGGERTPCEPPFTSEAALRRVLARTCRMAGNPLRSDEGVVERTLPDGSQLSAITGIAALSGTMLVIHRARRVELSLGDLVRRGTISRAMATFLQHCAQARANVLVSGPRDAGTSALISALTAAGPPGRIVAVQQKDEQRAGAVLLGDAASRVDPARLVHVAAAVPDARLVVDSFTGDVAAATIDAIGEGADGVIAAVRAPSLRRALGRITADLCAARSGLSVAAARESLAASLDLAVEVSRLRDGRHRVLRIAEVSGVAQDEVQLTDIFTFTVERTAAGGSVEGTFNATGVIPRFVEHMNARGIVLDASLFTRPPSR